MPRSLRLAHISDIHCTGGGVWEPEGWDAGVKLVNEMRPDAVLISGDFTDWGLRAEWEKIVPRLDELRAPKVTCLGNHDARREGWRIYEEMLGRDRYYATRIKDVDFIVLDSSQPDLDDGEVGREQRGWLRDRLREAEFPVVVLHHHLVPIPNTGREMNICRDSGGVLKILSEWKVPLVLGGHRHMPWAWELNETLIAHAGTFSSNKRQMPHSFNMVTIGEERVKVELVKFALDGNAETSLIADACLDEQWGGQGREDDIRSVHEAGLRPEGPARGGRDEGQSADKRERRPAGDGQLLGR